MPQRKTWSLEGIGRLRLWVVTAAEGDVDGGEPVLKSSLEATVVEVGHIHREDDSASERSNFCTIIGEGRLA